MFSVTGEQQSQKTCTKRKYGMLHVFKGKLLVTRPQVSHPPPHTISSINQRSPTKYWFQPVPHPSQHIVSLQRHAKWGLGAANTVFVSSTAIMSKRITLWIAEMANKSHGQYSGRWQLTYHHLFSAVCVIKLSKYSRSTGKITCHSTNFGMCCFLRYFILVYFKCLLSVWKFIIVQLLHIQSLGKSLQLPSISTTGKPMLQMSVL